MIGVVVEQRPQMIARAASGDAHAFAALIEPLLNPAYRLAAVMLADRSAADDAVQEASIKAWRKLGQLHGDAGSLRSWFLSIVANECRMVRRQRWWSVAKVAEILPLQSGRDHFDETSSDLKTALLRLSPDERLPAGSLFLSRPSARRGCPHSGPLARGCQVPHLPNSSQAALGSDPRGGVLK